MSGEGRAAAVDAGAGQAVRQAEAGEVIANPRRVPGGTQAFRCRELVREHHARGDRFTVEQAVRIAGFGLQRVAEAVAEVEQRADVPRLAHVGGDDATGRTTCRGRVVRTGEVAGGPGALKNNKT